MKLTKNQMIIASIVVVFTIVYFTFFYKKKPAVIAVPAGPAAPSKESGFKASVAPVKKSLNCVECLASFKQSLKGSPTVSDIYPAGFVNIRIKALEKCLNTGQFPESYSNL